MINLTEFTAADAKIERTMVRVHFPGLKVLYFNENLLLAIAATIGKPTRVDHNTINVERGRFAKVYMEIDLSQPVVGKFWTKGKWYKVENEGLHLICTACGCYGHMARNCSKGCLNYSPLQIVPIPEGKATLGPTGFSPSIGLGGGLEHSHCRVKLL